MLCRQTRPPAKHYHRNQNQSQSPLSTTPNPLPPHLSSPPCGSPARTAEHLKANVSGDMCLEHKLFRHYPLCVEHLTNSAPTTTLPCQQLPSIIGILRVHVWLKTTPPTLSPRTPITTLPLPLIAPKPPHHPSSPPLPCNLSLPRANSAG